MLSFAIFIDIGLERDNGWREERIMLIRTRLDL